MASDRESTAPLQLVVRSRGRQDINRRVGLSGRWNKSFERFNAGARESLAAGFTFTGVGNYEDDWISIGYFYGKPIDRSLDEEHGMEI